MSVGYEKKIWEQWIISVTVQQKKLDRATDFAAGSIRTKSTLFYCCQSSHSACTPRTPVNAMFTYHALSWPLDRAHPYLVLCAAHISVFIFSVSLDRTYPYLFSLSMQRTYPCLFSLFMQRAPPNSRARSAFSKSKSGPSCSVSTRACGCCHAGS